MIFEETYLLANGQRIPKFALGTWQVSDEDAGGAVKTALEIGYRHIDTAAAYVPGPLKTWEQIILI